MDREWNALLRERQQCGFGNDVLAVLQNFAGESPQEKSQGLLLRLAVRKRDHDHGGYPFEKLARLYPIAGRLEKKLRGARPLGL